MIRDRYNIIPMLLAGLLHAGVFAVLFVTLDWARPAYPAIPLAMTATLMPELPEPELPDPEPPPPEPEPEPEPEIDAEQERRRLEEEKRLADLQAEQERIRIQEEADRQRREAEEAEQRRLREQEIERRRAEAERKRQEDLERQRQENLRARREAEERELARRQQQEIEAEARRLEAMTADDTTRWVFALQQAIAREFVLPASAPTDLECVVDIRQTASGQVLTVNVRQERCNGDATVVRAIEAAVQKASPLPSPRNPAVFERDLQITFKPEQ